MLHILWQVTQSGEWLASKFSPMILCILIESFSFSASLHCIIEYTHGSPLSTIGTMKEDLAGFTSLETTRVCKINWKTSLTFEPKHSHE